MNESKVTFIDTSAECISLMRKYAKDGLKAGGKVITKILREDIKANHYKTGGLYKSIKAWAKIDYKTGQPYMEVGYKSKKEMQKQGIKYWVNPWWLEVGYAPHQIATKQYIKTGHSNYELMDNKGTKYGFIVQHPGKPAKNLLRNTVYNNIDEIRKAQMEHLKKITEVQVVKGLTIDDGGDEEIDD